MMFAKRTLNITVGCWLLLLVSIGVQAQDVELYELQIRDLKLGKVVTTTSRGGSEKIDKVDASIIVITEEDIRNRGYFSLLDIFHDLPDFKVEHGVDPRWMNDVSIRGIHRMDRFIILMDGVRVSSPTNDIIPIMENYPVHFAKQVEILYGPSSASYGADAFAGVVNIITKSGDKEASITLLGGTLGVGTGNLFLGGKLSNRLSYSIAAQYHYDQQPKYWEYYPEDYFGLDSLRTGTFNSVFGPIPVPDGISPEPAIEPIKAHGIYASIASKRLKLSFFNNYAHLSSTTAGSPNNTVYNKGALFGHGVSVLNMVYTSPISHKITSQTYLTSSYYRLNPQSNFWNVYTGFQKAYLFSLGFMQKAEEIISYNPNPKLNMTIGGTFEYFYSRPRGHDLNEVPESLNPEGVIIGSRLPNNPSGIHADLPTVKFNNLGFFAQVRWGPSDFLSLKIGNRFDYNSRFGLTVNPRIGIVVTPHHKTTLKLLAGSAYLAPSPLMAYDQFGSFLSFDNGNSYESFFMRLPNPNLQPQKILSGEASGIYNVNKRAKLTATVFISRLTGLFDYEVNGPVGTALHNNSYEGWPVHTVEVSVNQGRQVNYGGNIRLDFKTVLSKNSSIDYYASLSLVDGVVDRDDEGPLPEAEIPAVSPRIFRLGASYKKGKFTLSPRLVLVDNQRTFSISQNPTKRQTIPSYTLANVHVIYQQHPQWRIFLRVNNLFEQRYHNVNLGAAPEQSGSGAAQAEQANGAPQAPLRIHVGTNITF